MFALSYHAVITGSILESSVASGRKLISKIPHLTHEIRAGFEIADLDGIFFSVLLLLLFALSSRNNFLWSLGMACSGGNIFSEDLCVVSYPVS